ncbi:MAG: C40 family peptidase [Taibaiella sp.]|nr:C40 family peptidase [Taibaiella sp.]
MRYSYLILLLFVSCRPTPVRLPPTIVDTPRLPLVFVHPVVPTDSVLAAQVVVFAKTLIGTPYKFGCTIPSAGFDCSGFINYVFHHFNMDVPRSSVDFTNEGTPVPLADALPGDLILFTGTNSNIRTVGHMGLIVAHDTSGISFIHASSGKENAVIITKLNDRYMARFVKVIRIRK